MRLVQPLVFWGALGMQDVLNGVDWQQYNLENINLLNSEMIEILSTHSPNLNLTATLTNPDIIRRMGKEVLFFNLMHRIFEQGP